MANQRNDVTQSDLIPAAEAAADKLQALCSYVGVDADAAAIRAVVAELKAARTTIRRLHLAACTDGNCVLDGGPEHDAAFAELGCAAASGLHDSANSR